MTLTTRLMLFFLSALALVLIGFSATVYLLAQTHLHRRAEDRVEAALNTLAAAVEVEPEGLEWDLQERHPSQDMDDGPVPWLVTDGQGKWLDGSGHFFPNKRLADSPLTQATGPGARQVVSWQEQPWVVGQRRLESAHLGASTAREQRGQKQAYPVLVIKAGVSLEPVGAALGKLGGSLAGLSAGTWLLALVGGRWLCRRALLPVTRMAAAARTMDASALEQRLPAAETGDELADLGSAFNELLARLHESFERQQRFTGDASHQMRTPLTAILGQLEVALRRDRSTAEYQKVLASVQGQAQHLRQIVEMLLFLARADAEAKLPNLQIVSLGDWLGEHLGKWAEHERFGDVRLQRTGEDPLFVAALPPLLGQLVDNLLDNACKYSQAGTPVTLRLGAEKDTVLLAVEDAGLGIAPGDLPHVFAPFFRAAAARREGYTGVGLGLAIAERIAAALGGRISVVSAPGKGSCFTVALPRDGGIQPRPM